MARRVLVTGAAGQLGSVIVGALRPDCDVVPLARPDLDITDHRAVMDRVSAARPDAIVNCAAYNRVDQAEQDAVPALQVNAFAVRSLAQAAAAVGATLVHYSTDFVFDGTADQPYREDDPPNPGSVYAASKLLGEWFALEAPGAFVLRVESLFGGVKAMSSVDRVADAIIDGREARVFTDRTVSPSYVVDVAAATRVLLDRRAEPGLYHCVNTGFCTWHELGLEIARLLGCEATARLVPVRVADVPLVASRPRFAALSNAKLGAIVPMPTWQDALARYLRSRKPWRDAYQRQPPAIPRPVRRGARGAALAVAAPGRRRRRGVPGHGPAVRPPGGAGARPGTAQQLGLTDQSLVGPDGRQDVAHFWFFPLLAAPFVRVSRLAGWTDPAGLVALNAGLLLAAAWCASRRLAWPGLLLLFGSPIIWWTNKVHVEPFTFSLLTMAVSLARDAPAASQILLGVAATQNPPIAALIPIVAACSWPSHRRRRVLAISSAAGLALAALHPAYYWLRLGRLTALVSGEEVRLPGLQALGATIWDPNVGLLVNDPALPLAVLILALGARRFLRSMRWDGWLSVGAAAVFLVAFGQTENLNHGATPSMSRYALWMIPLAVPWLAADVPGVMVRPWTRRLVVAVSVSGAIWSAVYFHPSKPERYLEPSRLAAFLWERYPGLNNPPPEIFAERLRHQEPANTLAATPSCSKALLTSGQWPSPCSPAPVPAQCQGPGVMCYANRRPNGYDFVMTSRRGGYRLALPGWLGGRARRTTVSVLDRMLPSLSWGPTGEPSEKRARP